MPKKNEKQLESVESLRWVVVECRTMDWRKGFVEGNRIKVFVIRPTDTANNRAVT